MTTKSSRSDSNVVKKRWKSLPSAHDLRAPPRWGLRLTRRSRRLDLPEQQLVKVVTQQMMLIQQS